MLSLVRQIALSVLVLVAAAALVVVFVPGARDTLAQYGVSLPFGAPASVETAARPGGGPPGAGGPPAGGRGGFGGARGPQVVVTSAVTEAVINDRLSAIGEGAASRSVTVTAPAVGTLAEVLVEPGETVAADAVLARLDDAEARIALERAQLAARDAEAALQRQQELARSNSVSAVAVANAQLVFDNAALELRNAELALSRREIVTPIAGTVGLLNITEGNAVAAQTVVTTVEDISDIIVSFWVPERYAPSIAPGIAVTADAVALPGRSFEGVVSAVDNRIDPASRTLKVLARLPNVDGAIRPGMSFSVLLNFSGETYPSVDPLSVQWGADGAYVWKYADGKVIRTAVSIIQRNGDGVLVRGELSPGDQVVIQGVQQLVDGGEVRLLDAPSGAPLVEGSASGAGRRQAAAN